VKIRGTARRKGGGVRRRFEASVKIYGFWPRKRGEVKDRQDLEKSVSCEQGDCGTAISQRLQVPEKKSHGKRKKQFLSSRRKRRLERAEAARGGKKTEGEAIPFVGPREINIPF